MLIRVTVHVLHVLAAPVLVTSRRSFRDAFCEPCSPPSPCGISSLYPIPSTRVEGVLWNSRTGGSDLHLLTVNCGVDVLVGAYTICATHSFFGWIGRTGSQQWPSRSCSRPVDNVSDDNPLSLPSGLARAFNCPNRMPWTSLDLVATKQPHF